MVPPGPRLRVIFPTPHNEWMESMKRTLKFAVCVLGSVLCLRLLLQADTPHVSSGTWVPAGNMTEARTGASAVLLLDGRILITGGQGADGPLASAELVNSDGSFSIAAPMRPTPRVWARCRTTGRSPSFSLRGGST